MHKVWYFYCVFHYFVFDATSTGNTITVLACIVISIRVILTVHTLIRPIFGPFFRFAIFVLTLLLFRWVEYMLWLTFFEQLWDFTTPGVSWDTTESSMMCRALKLLRISGSRHVGRQEIIDKQWQYHGRSALSINHHGTSILIEIYVCSIYISVFIHRIIPLFLPSPGKFIQRLVHFSTLCLR